MLFIFRSRFRVLAAREKFCASFSNPGKAEIQIFSRPTMAPDAIARGCTRPLLAFAAFLAGVRGQTYGDSAMDGTFDIDSLTMSEPIVPSALSTNSFF